MIRATDMLGSEVRTLSGVKLGRVRDLRVTRAEGGPSPWRLDGLVVGKRAMLERLGITGAKRAEPIISGDLVRWTTVKRVEEGLVVVAEDALEHSRG
jgi:sporulation protein YlmC with PRC-barrel domain